MALDIASFVIEKLTNPMLQEVTLLYGVAGKVAAVRSTLEHIKVFIEAAEKRKGKGDDDALRLLVDQFREVSFRIEDAIDIYLLEVKGDHHSFGFLRWFYKILKKPVALNNLGVELNDIEATLKKIDENRERFGLNTDPGGSKGWELENENPSIRRRYEFPDNEIVGLENEKKDILEKLLGPRAQNLHVVSIVGPGGLGKTTLARKIFHSTEVIENFGDRIWISVSQNFDTISILKKMLENFGTITQEEKDRTDEDYFIKEIRRCLKEKRVLVVLDDIWDETLWPNIRLVCPDDMDRGRVLITTRNINVATKARSEPYPLKFLNLEESKMLLYKVSFPYEEPPKGLDLAATKIAKKCRGLPLAVVVVGGRLYMEKKNSEWRKVAENIDWGSDRECMQILVASYADMPSILKTCFLYLASYPEDCTIDAKALVRIWVAEGLASDEVTAQNYLQELAQRCLVNVTQKAYEGSIEEFWVHDLLQELAIKKANETRFLSLFVKQIPDQISFNNARRASLQSCTFDRKKGNKFENERKMTRKHNKKLRALLVFTKSMLVVDNSLPNNLSRFRLLKVLKVHGSFISSNTLEKWCEKLIHLRHLELRDCKVENDHIPKCIGHLENLLTLDCTDTTINKLPESLWSIKALRHVVMNYSGLTKFSQPSASADLPNLRTLCGVRLEPAAPNSSPNPRLDGRSYHMPNLRELVLSEIKPWVATLLKEPKQLVTLKLSNILYNIRQELMLDVLDMRGFPWYQSLQCLELVSMWPQHVNELRAHLLPPNLIELHLYVIFSFIKHDPMPVLEQFQYLEKLRILCDNSAKELICSAGGFPQLQELWLANFKAEEFKITPGAMPMLKLLKLVNFTGMKNIPEIQHLKMLREFYWSGSPYSDVEIQAMKEKEQAKIQHIPSVVIKPYQYRQGRRQDLATRRTL